MKYSDLDIPVPFYPSMAIFQKIDILHQIYPSVIHGCNSILNMTYIDYEKLSYAVLRNVLHTNANIHQRMKIIEAELSKKKIIRGGDLSGSTLPSGNAAASGAPNPPGEGAKYTASSAAEQLENPGMGVVPCDLFCI